MANNYKDLKSGLQIALQFGDAYDRELILSEKAKVEERERLSNKEFVPEHFQTVLNDPNGRFLLMFSGGKDSIAMHLRLLDMGVPPEKIELWHHEVDGGGEQMFDWPCTTSYCQAYADAFGSPLLFSYIDGGIRSEMYKENEVSKDIYFQDRPYGKFKIAKAQGKPNTRRKFPAISGDLRVRWCSDIAKIRVSKRAINNSDRLKEGNFLVLTGERRQESKNRANYEIFEQHSSKTKNRNIWTWRCVLDWTEKEVWEIIEKYRVQPHPCYELGYPRCSCMTCIFLSPSLWANTASLSPSTVDKFESAEEEFDFTLHDKKKIRDYISKGSTNFTESALLRWKDEALNVFQSPIIVDNWKMPPGAFIHESSGAI